MTIDSAVINSVVDRLVRYRWILSALMICVTLVCEVAEHNPLQLDKLQLDFVADLALYGVLLPSATGAALTLIGWARSYSRSEHWSTLRSERRRIARDLHDSIGQELGCLHLKLDLIAGAVAEDERIHHELELAREIADQAYREVRLVLSTLQPDLSGNLAANLQHYIQIARQWTSLDVHVTAEGLPREISSALQNEILYIVREALTNVQKHAHARRVEIGVRWAADALTVQVTDDGCGFDTGQAHSGHFGLDFMRERAQSINGWLDCRSFPGAGTQLTLSLQLPSERLEATRPQHTQLTNALNPWTMH